MDELENFVEMYFQWRRDNYEYNGVDTNDEILSLNEKVLLYAYTDISYEHLNENLRNRTTDSWTQQFETYLNAALSKLPDYTRLVYRGAILTEEQIQRYRDALQNNENIQEDAFISTSKSRTIAREFAGANTLFRITSLHGKNIEQFSCHGLHTDENEEEILFASKTQFRVISVTNEAHLALLTITMEEL